MMLIIPQNERLFINDMKLFSFSEARSRKLMKVMGYDRHRVVQDGVCASDLAEFGMTQLFQEGKLMPEELDALVYVSACPDHFLPPTSRILHGKLGLKQEALCFDLTQGCCGFEEGLIQAFLLLEQPEIQKVALVTSDVLSRKVSERDRNSYPLIGDAASITIVEKAADDSQIHGIMKNDGTRCMALQIPAGAFRLPSSAETAVMTADEEGNYRSLDNLAMDGTTVFNFVMADVPPMLNELFTAAGKSIASYDYFLFHQPNRFMLQKLADKLGVPYEKMPANVVEKFGNSSGTTVPAATVLNLKNSLTQRNFSVCFAGFGVGLTWGAVSMNIGPFNFCDLIEFPNQ